jgi:hypothetical protein
VRVRGSNVLAKATARKLFCLPGDTSSGAGRSGRACFAQPCLSDCSFRTALASSVHLFLDSCRLDLRGCPCTVAKRKLGEAKVGRPLPPLSSPARVPPESPAKCSSSTAVSMPTTEVHNHGNTDHE